MVKITVIYWRDIPAQVVAKAGRRAAKIKLDVRFERAIDMAAMRAGLAGSDDYLEQWRRSEPIGHDGEPEDAARASADRLEEEFDDERLAEFVANGGHAP